MDFPQQDEIRRLVCGAFPAVPPVNLMTLEAGNDVDSYRAPKPDMPGYRTHRSWLEIEDAYLSKFFCGFIYLDPSSWKFYLPRFITFALDHMNDGSSLVIDSCLAALRPPDREPPQLGSLTTEQVEVVKRALTMLAFDENSSHRDMAFQVLEEGWVENPMYPWREEEKSISH